MSQKEMEKSANQLVVRFLWKNTSHCHKPEECSYARSPVPVRAASSIVNRVADQYLREPHRVTQRPRLKPFAAGTGQALHITSKLSRVRTKWSSQAINELVAALEQDDAAGHLQVYRDGSMQQSTGTARTSCTPRELGTSQMCSLPFPTSSILAELAGLNVVADLLLEQVTHVRGHHPD